MNYTQEEILDALRVADLALMSTMLQDGVSVNSFMTYKKTDILLLAIFKENLFLINYILSLGFNCEKNKILYLHHAIRIGNTFVLEKLLKYFKENNLNINQKDSNGNNLFHIACSDYNEQNAKVVVYLCDELKKFIQVKGNVWTIKNKNKETALHLLLRKNYPLTKEIVEHLKNEKMKVFNIKDGFNLTAKDIIMSYANSKSWLKNSNHKELFKYISQN